MLISHNFEIFKNHPLNIQKISQNIAKKIAQKIPNKSPKKLLLWLNLTVFLV